MAIAPIGFVTSGNVRVPRQLKYFRDHIKRHARANRKFEQMKISHFTQKESGINFV